VQKLVRPFVENWKLISLTFEIFWIAVFLLHAASSSAPQVTQFGYANF
jgi:hypothetical protein